MPNNGRKKGRQLLAGLEDGSVVIARCVYSSKSSRTHAGGRDFKRLVKLVVRRRVELPPAGTSLPAGGRWWTPALSFLASGSVDGCVSFLPLTRRREGARLEGHHSAPVVALASNAEGSVLASGDAHGHAVLWLCKGSGQAQ